MITAYSFSLSYNKHIDIYRTGFWLNLNENLVSLNTRRRQILLTHEGYSAYWRGYLEVYQGSMTLLCPVQNNGPPVFKKVFLGN